MTKFKCSDSEFIEIVANSTSIASVLKACNLVVAGGNYRTVHNRIQKLNLNTDHFTGQGWTKGKTFGPKRPLEDYLTNNVYINSHALRRRLLKESIFPHVCSCCRRTEWLEKPIPLELHHKDGNHANNTLDNLSLLCPNCHSFTDSYRGKNKSKSSLGVAIAKGSTEFDAIQ